MFEKLPTLGVGVSLSLSAQPDPVALVQSKDGPHFVEYAGLVDVERVIAEVDRVRACNIPVLYHPSYINFCGSFPNSSAWLDSAANHIKAVNSAWFAQDCAYCFWQEGSGYSTQFGYFIPPVFNEASLAMAITRVQEVQQRIPVPVAIEPPPMMFSVGSMPLFEFFGRLAEATDCAILLDMGHLVSYEMASGQKVLDAIHHLDCKRVIEVHIAGGKIHPSDSGRIYVDAHECSIVEETWQMLESLLPKLPNVKAVCFECEGTAKNQVLLTLKRLRKSIHKYSSCKALIATIGSRHSNVQTMDKQP